MNRALKWTACLVLAAAAARLPLAAAETPAAKSAAPSGLRGDFLLSIADAETKLESLIQAVPAEKLDWRPGPGVRSFREVFLHVAGGIYFIPTLWGAKPPAGIDMRKLEQSTGDKTTIAATLKASYDHLRKEIEALSDKDFDRAIDMFGHKSTVRFAALVVVNHSHEHLGQAIAYARVNGIVPPWSEKEGAPPSKQNGK
jgi:uncharacterized damage-inducible protein DinB